MNTVPPAKPSSPANPANTAIPATARLTSRDWLAEALRCEDLAVRSAGKQHPSHPSGTCTRAAGV